VQLPPFVVGKRENEMKEKHIMKRTQSIANLAAAIALVASVATLKAEPILYSTTGAGSTLARIDVGAGTVSEIGPLGEPFALAIAMNASGRLFTVTDSLPGVPGTPQLASVNRATGVAKRLKSSLGAEIFMGIGFAPDGTLYGVNTYSGMPDQGSLCVFNTVTGEATKVGETGGCFDIMDLAFLPDGTMYGAAWNSLYRIDQDTGVAQVVAIIHSALTLQPLAEVMGLAIDDDGNFYVTEVIANSSLWRVDPITGAATPVAGVNLSFPHGLDFVPTPFARPTSTH
jgi:hypothetical protein